MEFTISQEIKDMIKKGRDDALMRCALYGHDYRNMDGISGGEICICCGGHLTSAMQPVCLKGGIKLAEKYKCAMCGGIFEKVGSEEAALTELHEQFGEKVAVEDCDIVCDDCWQKVRPDNPKNKEICEAWQANQALDSDGKKPSQIS